MDRVIVLMSTYNGEKYIREQLDSIFNQKNIAVKVVIRDDGSNDATQSILDEYKKKHNLNWYTGKNLNAAWSFMELINNAPDSNFYAFADQDDVWDNDKLFIAVEAMKNCGTETNEKAIMYSCPTRLVDEKLNSIGNLKHNNSYTSSFAGSLIASNATGCTIVFNKKLLDYMQIYQGKNLRMHDDLAHKVCCAVGGILIRDEKPHISYRQHENNVIGANNSLIKKWKLRLNRILISNCERSQFLSDMYIFYGDYMKVTDKNLLLKVINYRKSFLNRIKVIGNPKLKGGNIKMSINFRMAILLGIF
ncbi:glycosyltransferase family 2 protein [Enterococcus faecium]|uniref:glycosyltransferase family 2 protein n=3 Tax=Enterococcus faecium TaxID=1352 RepID=UPI0002A422C0|nr:glycosyltransferase family 2 protein [Enterococcus faecium]EGP4720268.1 glycosyltransferase family 2 protein [Enterococcus faecium]EGP5194788.1 glycosyltransferase family 2 protein [Enterococcus faecium]EGP5346733.1 glycosyltransferase family 2 protein [Enterococcus faecium]ELA61239.1 hypothetical protein OGE_02965 [Enterococcus faecium EnGen0022]EMF0411444.1 glycosyltransferase family 2 protein [Enterococcus faecium]